MCNSCAKYRCVFLVTWVNCFGQAQVKDKLQQLLDDRSLEDSGSVLDPVPDEDQYEIINDVLRAYKGTHAPAKKRITRNRVGPTVAELRSELERTKAEAEAKEAEFKAREAESKAALDNVQGRLKAIEDMVSGFGFGGLGVAAPSDGASIVRSNFLSVPP